MATNAVAAEKREETERNADLLAALTIEAKKLKKKLDEEKSKLHDAEFGSITQRVDPLPPLPLRCRRILRGHQGKVLCMDWGTDGQHMVSSSQDGKVIIWDAFTSSKEYSFATPTSWVMTCAYSPSQSFFACGGLDNKCNVYTIGHHSSDCRPHQVAMHTSHVTSCHFTKSDNQLITGSGDSTCALWDVESATQIQRFKGHNGDVMSVDFSWLSGGTNFVSGGCDNTVRIWDMRIGRCVQYFDSHSADVNSVRYFPSGDAVASASDDATCRLFDLRADRELAVYGRESILFGANSVDFSFSGRLLIAGYNDYTVHLWDTLKVGQLGILFGHENRVSSVRVAPDGAAVASGSWDWTVKIWA